MIVQFLSGGRLNMRVNVYDPELPRDLRMDLPVVCVLLRHPQGNVLFDTGCHPDVAENADARWGSLVRVMKPVFAPQDTVVHQLSSTGLAASDIDVVVCSHLHADHCGCNSFFPRATLVCSTAELEDAQSPDAAASGFLRSEWEHGGPVDGFSGVRDLFGDGRMTLLPAPGHTRGMIIAHVVTDHSGAFVLASDAAPMASTLRRRVVPRNSWDIEATGRTLDDIARLEADGARVIYGHDETQWRELQSGPAQYG